ncbi:hypothetical protein RhiirB3_461500, partial [Rhizophagus irregularis]
MLPKNPKNKPKPSRVSNENKKNESIKGRPLSSKNTITVSEVSTPIRKASSSVNEKKNNKKKVTSRNTYEVSRKTPEIPAFTLQVPRSMLEESA